MATELLSELSGPGSTDFSCEGEGQYIRLCGTHEDPAWFGLLLVWLMKGSCVSDTGIVCIHSFRIPVVSQAWLRDLWGGSDFYTVHAVTLFAVILP